MIYYIGPAPAVESTFKLSTVEDCLEYFKNHESIAIDTETQGRDPHIKKILSLQIGDANNQYVIDCRYTDIKKFKDLLESKLCILHNAKFDYKFLKASGIVMEYIYDTMLSECVIYAGYESFGYGLKDLTNRYLNIDLDKTTRGDFYKLTSQPFTDKQIEYAALDVAYLHQIKELQHRKIRRYDLQYCVDLENEVVKALADIEYNGISFNVKAWLDNARQYEAKQKDIEGLLDTIVVGDPILSIHYKPKYVQTNLFDLPRRESNINYSSPSQIHKIFRELGYEVESTDDRTLSKYVDKHAFFKKLQEYREVSKIVSTYGEAFCEYINPHTMKIHTDFWQIKSTGRVSSGSKDMNAPNMQNLPQDNKFRNCFIASPGFSWISIDYSAQELRLMADGSKEEGFINVLNAGEDLHCYAGSMMFKKTITKADKDLRNKAKTINFGKPYGMGPNKLADTLSIGIDEAEELFRVYAESFPKLNKWLADQGRAAKNNMYSVTFAPCKRRRWYPDMKKARELRATVQEGDKETWKQIMITEGQTERNGMNHPIQGSGADITKEALVGIRNLILETNKMHKKEVARLLCTVHDQIDVEVIDEIAQDFADQMKKIMIESGNKYVKDVNMEVDVTITKVWTK
jgi:DNA polymerase I-like protein with 3'-5' exonuclease and polymerase domains